MTLGAFLYVTSPIWCAAAGWYGHDLYVWWQGLDK